MCVDRVIAIVQFPHQMLGNSQENIVESQNQVSGFVPALCVAESGISLTSLGFWPFCAVRRTANKLFSFPLNFAGRFPSEVCKAKKRSLRTMKTPKFRETRNDESN